MAYATIVIPTLDRFSTLSTAIECARNQTVDDLDIVVVLDGSPDRCRQVALRQAAVDDRLRILDRPKAPGLGGRNINEAVATALGPRIFYSDDDDVLRPNHVEVLGALLDESDVVSSRLASVDLAGGISLGAFDPANPIMRRLLATGAHKAVRDAHLAHTIDVHRSVARWPEGTERSVLGFFGALAGSSCTWMSTTQITAISVQGGSRTQMSTRRRQEENDQLAADWSDLARQPPPSASSVEFVWRLWRQDPPGPGVLARDHLESHGAYEGVAEDPLVVDLLDVLSGSAVSRDRGERLFVALATPTVKTHPIAPLADLAVAALGREAGIEVVARHARTRGPRQVVSLAVMAMLQRRTGRQADAIQTIEEALAIGPDPMGQLAGLRDRMARVPDR